MIHKISKFIVDYLKEKKVIDNCAVYQYGCELLVSTILGFTIVIAISLIANKIIVGMIFLVMFVNLRSYTGGYHANSYMKCNLTLTSIYIILMLIVLYLNLYLVLAILCLLTPLSIIVIFQYSPISNGKKIIEPSARIGHNKKAKRLTIIYTIIAFLLCFVSLELSIAALYVLFVVSIMMLFAIKND